MRRAYFVLALVTALCLAAAPALLAQAKKSAEPTTDELDKAIRDQIAAKAKATGGKFSLTDITVHKINGKPRYMYEQKGDVWVRVPVQEKKSS